MFKIKDEVIKFINKDKYKDIILLRIFNLGLKELDNFYILLFLNSGIFYSVYSDFLYFLKDRIVFLFVKNL